LLANAQQINVFEVEAAETELIASKAGLIEVSLNGLHCQYQFATTTFENIVKTIFQHELPHFNFTCRI